jgi:hypothetical protein
MQKVYLKRNEFVDNRIKVLSNIYLFCGNISISALRPPGVQRGKMFDINAKSVRAPNTHGFCSSPESYGSSGFRGAAARRSTHIGRSARLASAQRQKPATVRHNTIPNTYPCLVAAIVAALLLKIICNSSSIIGG